MRGTGTVEAIYVAPEAEVPMQLRGEVEAVAGKGLSGDRYCKGIGTFSHITSGGRDLTLTEAEAVKAIEHEADIDIGFDEHRRNITTRDVALNHLVGEKFQIGEAICRGVRLCEPCNHLERLTVEGIEESLIHRGGLRADITESGTVKQGDTIEPL